MFKELVKQITTVVISGLLILSIVLWFMYKGEQKKVSVVKSELEQARVDLGTCKQLLAVKPTVIKKTEYVEVLRIVDSSGNVVSVSTSTHATHDESIVMQPKEIIREIIKEAPIRRWTLSASIPASIEDIKHLNIETIGIAYQPWKSLNLSVGGLYIVDNERLLLHALIRF